jgi:TRAP-type C4-dicarboxylate transport system substrate-binding protein
MTYEFCERLYCLKEGGVAYLGNKAVLCRSSLTFNKEGKKMRKGLLVASLLISLSVLIILGALEDAAAKEKVYTLKLQTLYSEVQGVFESVKFFANQVEKKTKGRVKFKIFPGSSLVPVKQSLSAVHNGVLDSAFSPCSYEQGLWPITAIFGLFGAPNITYERWGAIHDKARDIINNNININVVVVGMAQVLRYGIYSRKPFTGKLEDFKGMLIRSAGGPYNAGIKALGGLPVKIPAPEVYMAVQKGTVDGAASIYSRYVEGHLYEIAPNFMVFPNGLFTNTQWFIVNKTIWNSLPVDIQKAINEAGKDVTAFTSIRSVAMDKKIIAETLPKLGVTPTIMTEAENNRLLQKLVPVWNEYIAKLGRPAPELARLLGVK